jgi:hypothetical protein
MYGGQNDTIYVSWLNVYGHKPCPPKAVFNYIIDSQRDLSLQLLQKLFSAEFSSVMDALISQDSFIAKLKDKFDILIQLMNTKSELIKPLIVKMCIDNAEFGEWVINKYLI